MSNLPPAARNGSNVSHTTARRLTAAATYLTSTITVALSDSSTEESIS